MKKLLSIFVALALCYTGIAQTGQKFTIEVSSGVDTTGVGDLYIRNQIASAEGKMTNYRSARMDSLFVRGAAQYLWNRAADFTSRSFTDKGYVDSVIAMLLRITDTSSMLSAYLRKADFRILDAEDVDSSGISDDDLVFWDSTLGRIRFKAFPTIFDYTNSDSGLYVINASGVTVHNGMLLWRGKADELYASLTGSYTNPTWIVSLPWSKITGAPSFLTSETDPIYSASSWFGTTNNSANWNTAFGWGNHASAGYSTASNTQTFTNKTWNGVAISDAYISSASAWNAKQAAYTNLTSIGSLANGSGWLRNNGSGTFSYTFPTATDVGLGNVTNESKATMFTSPTFTGTVSGVTKTHVGLSNVENTALSTWAGTTSITTLGTIATGTWNATAIGVSKGGVPTGGTTNQVLKKNSNTDYDVSWTTLVGGGDMLAANNLSDVANTTTARNNILPSKTGNAGKILAVNVGETDYELITAPSGGSSGLTSTATAAGTTTLTSSSTPKQVFTGTNTQTIVLPNATTLSAGDEFQITNLSSVALPLQYNDATLLEVLLQGSKTTFTLTDNSTSNGVWVVGEPELISNTHRKMPLIIGPSGSTTGPTSLGNSVTTGATLSNTTVANTNQWTSQIHKRFSTSATAGNASSLRSGAVQYYASNVAGMGGYKAEFICGNGNINLNGSQLFYGMQGSVNQIAGDPSALTNLIAMGYDAGDASTGNWFLMYNDGSGVATKVDLGATDAARGTDKGFYMSILVAPNSSTYYVKIVSVNTGALVYQNTLTTNVPAVNTLLGPHVQVRNGAVASAANVDMAYIKIQPF